MEFICLKEVILQVSARHAGSLVETGIEINAALKAGGFTLYRRSASEIAPMVGIRKQAHVNRDVDLHATALMYITKEINNLIRFNRFMSDTNGGLGEVCHQFGFDREEAEGLFKLTSDHIPALTNQKAEISTTTEEKLSGLKVREQQIREIEAAADALGAPRLAVPRGYKKQIRLHLSGYSDDSFEGAWREASKQGRIKSELHESAGKRHR